jgi:hypothetical protein
MLAEIAIDQRILMRVERLNELVGGDRPWRTVIKSKPHRHKHKDACDNAH